MKKISAGSLPNHDFFGWRFKCCRHSIDTEGNSSVEFISYCSFFFVVLCFVVLFWCYCSCLAVDVVERLGMGDKGRLFKKQQKPIKFWDIDGVGINRKMNDSYHFKKYFPGRSQSHFHNTDTDNLLHINWSEPIIKIKMTAEKHTKKNIFFLFVFQLHQTGNYIFLYFSLFKEKKQKWLNYPEQHN